MNHVHTLRKRTLGGLAAPRPLLEWSTWPHTDEPGVALVELGSERGMVVYEGT